MSVTTTSAIAGSTPGSMVLLDLKGRREAASEHRCLRHAERYLFVLTVPTPRLLR